MLADGLLCALIAVIALVPLAGAPKEPKGDPKDARTQLHALFDEEWEFELSENPLAATAVGEHRWDDKLPSVRVADEARRAEARRRFRERLLAIDAAAGLPRP